MLSKDPLTLLLYHKRKRLSMKTLGFTRFYAFKVCFFEQKKPVKTSLCLQYLLLGSKFFYHE